MASNSLSMCVTKSYSCLYSIGDDLFTVLLIKFLTEEIASMCVLEDTLILVSLL